MPEKKPMPLEKLPDYLKSAKPNGSPVVDMGHIVIDKKPWWSLPRIAALLMVVVLGVGIVSYDSLTTKQMRFVVDINEGADPLQAIPDIVSDGGGQAISVKHKEDSTYEVEVTTRKSRSSFLEWLRNNREIKKAELEESP